MRFMRIPCPGAIIGADPCGVVCLVLRCSFSQSQTLGVANEAAERVLLWRSERVGDWTLSAGTRNLNGLEKKITSN